VGRMTSGFVVGCSVSGSVKGRTQAGGIAGYIACGEIRRGDIGGIAGRMTGGRLINNANTGVIRGGEAVGGVVGNFFGMDPDFSLTANRSTPNVQGHLRSGPLVGTQTQ
jgi:hypothetical protein